MNRTSLTVLGIVCLISIAFGTLLKPYFDVNTSAEDLHQKALAAYEAKDLDKAKSLLIKQGWETLLPRQEGCELVISIFAESSDWPNLEKASQWCVDHNLALGIAYEGIGRSFVEQGRGEQAIKILSEGLEKSADKTPEIRQRIKDALAHVYLLIGDSAKSKEILFQK